MKHVFSNSLSTRIDILQRALAPATRWEDIPVKDRIDILTEAIQKVEEVLSEVRS
jgi:hypothetical protein